MFDKEGKRYTKNIVGSSPAELLASVLEQRYSKTDASGEKGSELIPDPMCFPAVKQALGSVYEDLVEFTDEQSEMPVDENDLFYSKKEDMRGVVGEMTDKLLDMVDKIEENEINKQKEEIVKTEIISAKKKDPYNREGNNAYVEEVEIPSFDIPSMEIETSVLKPRAHRTFRNGDTRNEK